MSVVLRLFSSKVCFLSLFLVAGCNPFRYMAPDSTDIQTRDKAKWGDVPAPYPLYCYDTLADKVCYASPLAREKDRLMGYYGPPPHHHAEVME